MSGMARACNEYEITIGQLLRVVHSYTDPVRIQVVMADAWTTCDEAKNMHDFTLTKCCRNTDTEEQERLLKYYEDVPVWNLTVWMDGYQLSNRGRAFYTGIEARCHYKDMREGWLAERADIRREKQREYRLRKKTRDKEGTDD